MNLTIEEVRYYMYLEMNEILVNFMIDKTKSWQALNKDIMELRHIIYDKVKDYNMIDEMLPSELYKKMWIM